MTTKNYLMLLMSSENGLTTKELKPHPLWEKEQPKTLIY